MFSFEMSPEDLLQRSYKTLGLSNDASLHEIKQAYHKLALIYHPDRNIMKSQEEKNIAENLFKSIGLAYEYLVKESDSHQLPKQKFSTSSFSFQRADKSVAEFDYGKYFSDLERDYSCNLYLPKKQYIISTIAQAKVSSSLLIQAIAFAKPIDEIKKIINVNTHCLDDCDSFKNTPVHLAVTIEVNRNYREDLIRLLKESGSKMCPKNDSGFTPTHLAVKLQADDAYKLFVTLGIAEEDMKKRQTSSQKIRNPH